MNEVYLGAYCRGDANFPECSFPERLHGQSLISELEGSDASGRVAAGFGWQRYPRLTTLNESLFESRSDILYPRARYLLSLGAIALQNGYSVDPQDIAPAYMRDKVAEKPPREGT
jgi:tRNA A37 threonylcarbamoyladenosine modification protein TsaB